MEGVRLMTLATAMQGMLMASGGNAEFNTYLARIAAAGTSLTGTQQAWALAASDELKTKSYKNHILGLYPCFGDSIAAHLIPLRDVLNVGGATNHGFVDADASDNGLDNTAGAAKYLTLPVSPGQLHPSHTFGGMFWFSRAFNSTGSVEPMGCYQSGNRWVLDLRATWEAWRWDTVGGSVASSGVGAGSYGYYGQTRTLSEHKIFRGVTLLDTDTNAVTGNNNTTPINVFGRVDGTATYFKDRCGCFGYTDGQLSNADWADFHDFVQDFIITPTGR